MAVGGAAIQEPFACHGGVQRGSREDRRQPRQTGARSPYRRGDRPARRTHPPHGQGDRVAGPTCGRKGRRQVSRRFDPARGVCAGAGGGLAIAHPFPEGIWPADKETAAPIARVVLEMVSPFHSMNRPFVPVLLLVLDRMAWLRGRGRRRARGRTGSWSQCMRKKRKRAFHEPSCGPEW